MHLYGNRDLLPGFSLDDITLIADFSSQLIGTTKSADDVREYHIRAEADGPPPEHIGGVSLPPTSRSQETSVSCVFHAEGDLVFESIGATHPDDGR